MALLAVLSEGGTHRQRGGCTSSSVVGSSGQSSSNDCTYAHFHPAHILLSCQEPSCIARVECVQLDDGQWWVSRGCRLCRRWPLVPLVLCRTCLLELGCERSAARQSALKNELDSLHTSDHYDRMCGACRGQRRGEGCWERKGEAMGRVDRK